MAVQLPDHLHLTVRFTHNSDIIWHRLMAVKGLSGSAVVLTFFKVGLRVHVQAGCWQKARKVTLPRLVAAQGISPDYVPSAMGN